MSDRVSTILDRAVERSKSRTPTEKWFDEHPAERDDFIAAMVEAEKMGIPQKTIIEAAKESLGGPPTGYLAVGKWFDGIKKD